MDRHGPATTSRSRAHQGLAGRVSISDAALLLGLSERSIRRLRTRLDAAGPGVLAHGNCGREPAHTIDAALKARVVTLAKTTYAGATTATSPSSSPNPRAFGSLARACSACCALACRARASTPGALPLPTRASARGGHARPARGVQRQSTASSGPRRTSARRSRRSSPGSVNPPSSGRALAALGIDQSH
jgi:hypothetical protein